MDTKGFIARWKLQELRAQRDDLRTAYAACLAEADAAERAEERVRILYERLRELRLAGDPVHPELPDLSLVLRSFAFGVGDADAWERRLRAELERGRARSEAVYAYGALLEENASAAADVAPAVDAESFTAQIGAGDGDTPSACAPEGPLTALFDADGFGRFAEVTREKFEHGLGWVKLSEEDLANDPNPPPDGLCLDTILSSVLSRLAEDPERTDAQRSEARHHSMEFEGTDGTDLQKALEAPLRNAVQWRWPAAGVEPRAVQTGDRVRVHPTLDLIDTLIVEQIGEWFAAALPRVYTSHVNRRRRLERLLELNAPPMILDKERRIYASPLGVLGDPRVLEETTSTESVAAWRDVRLAGLWTLSLIPGGNYSYAGQSGDVVRLVNAELVFRRAQGRPSVVIRTDVESFYASVDHRLVLRILELCGVPDAWIEFVREFLRVPYRIGDAVHVASRGLPLGCCLSRALADVILAAGELFVRRRAPVLTIRSVDDLTIIADDAASAVTAWEAWREWLEACGLAVQEAKTGAVAIDTDANAALPTGGARYGVLALTPEGWRIDEDSFRALVDRTRARLEAAPSVLRAVRIWGDEARYLAGALVCDTPLGWADDNHGHLCTAAMRRFHDEVAPGGLESWLRAKIVDRLGHEPSTAWLRWPITAGGLGLYDPMIDLCTRKLVRPELPSEPPDETGSQAWGKLYEASHMPCPPLKPSEDAMSQARVKDFIARGSQVQGKKQEGLKPYWRWILAAHGDDILETFGTFRFLSHHLIPLELVSQRA